MPEGKFLEFGFDELRGEIMELKQKEAFDKDSYLFLTVHSLRS